MNVMKLYIGCSAYYQGCYSQGASQIQSSFMVPTSKSLTAPVMGVTAKCIKFLLVRQRGLVADASVLQQTGRLY